LYLQNAVKIPAQFSPVRSSRDSEW